MLARLSRCSMGCYVRRAIAPRRAERRAPGDPPELLLPEFGLDLLPGIAGGLDRLAYFARRRSGFPGLVGHLVLLTPGHLGSVLGTSTLRLFGHSCLQGSKA